MLKNGKNNENSGWTTGQMGKSSSKNFFCKELNHLVHASSIKNVLDLYTNKCKEPMDQDNNDLDTKESIQIIEVPATYHRSIATSAKANHALKKCALLIKDSAS